MMKHDAGDLNLQRAAAGGALAALQRQTGNNKRVRHLFFLSRSFRDSTRLPARRVSCDEMERTQMWAWLPLCFRFTG